MKKPIYYIFILLISLSFQAHGSANLDVISLASKSKLNKIERIEIARGFNAECKQLLMFVPILSPKENEWLDNEIKQVRLTVITTPEYSKRATRQLFTYCIDGSDKVINSKSSKEEALGWSMLLLALVNSYIDSFMVNSNVQALKDKSKDIKSAFSAGSLSIIRNILIPLLNENTNN